jgi:hypothetical protein
VEVVISFSESDKCGDDMVTGGVAIVERLVTEPMG